MTWVRDYILSLNVMGGAGRGWVFLTLSGSNDCSSLSWVKNRCNHSWVYFESHLSWVCLCQAAEIHSLLSYTGQFSLQVFYMSSLLRPSEFSAPVSTVLEVPLIRKVFWTPRREDRITLISTVSPQNNTKFDTFDMKLEGIGNKVTIQGKPYKILKPDMMSYVPKSGFWVRKTA